MNSKQKKFLEAYKESRGILYDALVASKTTKSEYDKWIEKSKPFAEEVEMLNLYAVSLVENRVMDIVQNTNLIDTKLLTWFLERRGNYAPKKEDKPTKDNYELNFK